MNLHGLKIKKTVEGHGSRSQYVGMLTAIYDYSNGRSSAYCMSTVWGTFCQKMINSILDNPIGCRLLADIAKYDDFDRIESNEDFSITVYQSWYYKEWEQIRANQRIRDAYIKLGIDRKAFADSLGYSERTVEKWISFRNLVSDRRITEAFRELEGESDPYIFGSKFRQKMGKL